MKTPRSTTVAALIALGLPAIGCGDPLTDGSYRGTPIFKVTGQVINRDGLPEELYDANFRVSLFWIPTDTLASPRAVEQPSITANVRFPTLFELRVFEPPTDEHMGDTSWGVGLVMVYIDVDGDGQYLSSAGEDIVGAVRTQGLIYARTDIDAESSPTSEALSAGFSLADLPLSANCEALIRRPPSTSSVSAAQSRPRGPCGPPCGRGLRCDLPERVCVNDETFRLIVDADFTLGTPICRTDS